MTIHNPTTGAEMRIAATSFACALLLLVSAGHSSGQLISGFAHDILTCVDVAPNGQYLVGGYSSSFHADETAAIICLLDATGRCVWVMDYDSESWDEAADVMADESGGYWLAGATRPNEDLFDWLVCKYDQQGRRIWSRIYFEEYLSAATSLISDGAGGAFVLGHVEVDGIKQLGLLHLDANGNVLWSHVSEFDQHHMPHTLARNPAGELVVAGQQNKDDSYASDLRVLVFDTDGTPQWDYTHALPWAQHCGGMDVTPDGDILIAGTTVADSASEETDGILLRLSEAGDLRWLRQFQVEGNDRCLDVLALEGDSALVCGVVRDQETGDKQAVLYLVDPDGSTEWRRNYTFGKHAEFAAIDGSSSQDYMAVGFADPSEAWMTDYLIATASRVIANEPVLLPKTIRLHAYPNPTNAHVLLEVTLPESGDLTISLHNVLGQRLSSIAYGRFTAGTHRLFVSLHQVASGNYFINATSPDLQAAPLRIVVVK